MYTKTCLSFPLAGYWCVKQNDACGYLVINARQKLKYVRAFLRVFANPGKPSESLAGKGKSICAEVTQIINFREEVLTRGDAML